MQNVSGAVELLTRIFLFKNVMGIFFSTEAITIYVVIVDGQIQVYSKPVFY